jgi:hypothetical protein
MRRVAFFIAFVLTGVVALPANAPAQEFRDVDARRALYGRAYCAVRNDLQDAKKLFTTPPGSKEEAKILRSLDAQNCALIVYGGPALEADRQLMRGVIAEAVYDQSVKKKSKVDPALAPFGNLSADAIAALDVKGHASLAGLDFAQCVVAASPEGAKALLNSSSTTGEQEKVLGQLQPYFAPCLPKGGQITFSKLMLRGLIAEAAYRTLYFTSAAGKN